MHNKLCSPCLSDIGIQQNGVRPASGINGQKGLWDYGVPTIDVFVDFRVFG